MSQIGNLFRKVAYHHLSIDNYLLLISKMYFTAFNLGFLKSDRVYAFPYFLKHIIKKGDIVIDIGANLGYLTVLFSKLVGKEGKVHAVEPVPMILKALRKNVNGLENVEIYPYALGKENKVIQLGNHSVPINGYIATGSHSIIENDSVELDMVFDAEMRRGSELFLHLSKLDFIKVDIEGYESVVLPEIQPVLEKFRPLVMIETTGQNRLDMLEYFQSIGYRGFELEKNRLFPVSKTSYWDILFVPDSKFESIQPFLNINN